MEFYNYRGRIASTCDMKSAGSVAGPVGLLFLEVPAASVLRLLVPICHRIAPFEPWVFTQTARRHFYNTFRRQGCVYMVGTWVLKTIRRVN